MLVELELDDSPPGLRNGNKEESDCLLLLCPLVLTGLVVAAPADGITGGAGGATSPLG